jgi:hypothetical protein
MKKFTQLLLVACLLIACQTNVFAQLGKITLSHNGISTFYTDFSVAQTAATDGDTIYLPGGTINPWTIAISKKLMIIGAGHYPDSTLATTPTNINSIYFTTGSDGTCLMGVKCAGNLYLNYNGTTTNQISVSRCYLSSLYLSDGNYVIGSGQNIVISECVIAYCQYGTTSSVVFSKNIINFLYSFNPNNYNVQSFFLNNIIYVNSSFTFNNSILNNNIFVTLNYSSTCDVYGYNSIFNNNLFCGLSSYLSVSLSGSNNYYNNIINQLASNTFIDATTNGFSYSNNYHLQSSSPGKNAGMDGTDVGIYGTSSPYKDYALPLNPHISSKNIGTSLSPTGKLNVDVKAVAQDR